MGNNPSRAHGGRPRAYSQDRGFAHAKRSFTTRGKRSKYDQEYVDEEDLDEYGRPMYGGGGGGVFPGQVPPQMAYQGQNHYMSMYVCSVTPAFWSLDLCSTMSSHNPQSQSQPRVCCTRCQMLSMCPAILGTCPFPSRRCSPACTLSTQV